MHYILLLSAFTTATFIGTYAGAGLIPGTIVGAGNAGLNSEGGPGTVLLIDPANGNQSVLSGFDPATNSTVGTGVDLELIAGVAIAGDTLFISDFGFQVEGEGAIVAIDVNTGARRAISGHGVGTGPILTSPADILLDGNGGLYVTDFNAGAVFRVDIATGDRVLVSGGGGDGASVGTGPGFTVGESLIGLAFSPTGDLLVVDRRVERIFEVDVATGNRTVLVPTNQLFAPSDLTVFDDGQIYVADFGEGIYLVDLAGGTASVFLSDMESGSDNALVDPFGIARASEDVFFVSDTDGSGSVFAVNRLTGEQSRVAGPLIVPMALFEVVPVPEPSSACMAAVLLMGFLRRSRRL